MNTKIGRWMMAAALVAAMAAPAAAPEKASPRAADRKLEPEEIKGLQWLMAHQLEGGGWGQGEESAQMGGGTTLRDVPNVADTCMAVLALLRSGSTPAKGEHAAAVRRGVDFVCGQVRHADADSLYVTEIRGTRLQAKIGGYVDTFLAAQMLTEVRGAMPEATGNAEVSNCLAKVLHKIEHNQRDNGTWAGDGWATAHSQAIAAKAVNRAVMYGVEVDETVRRKAQEQAGRRVDAKTGSFSADGSAGVDLYAAATAISGLQESKNVNDRLRGDLEQQLAAAPAASPERAQLQSRLDEIDEANRKLEAGRTALAAKMEDDRFIAGFGNNGGEEFLSYLNIGESLVIEGGEPLAKWETRMSDNLKRVQNGDGSWSGHHCITGRSFCTATALMVLMVDRMTLPAGGALARR